MQTYAQVENIFAMNIKLGREKSLLNKNKKCFYLKRLQKTVFLFYTPSYGMDSWNCMNLDVSYPS